MGSDPASEHLAPVGNLSHPVTVRQRGPVGSVLICALLVAQLAACAGDRGTEDGRTTAETTWLGTSHPIATVTPTEGFTRVVAAVPMRDVSGYGVAEGGASRVLLVADSGTRLDSVGREGSGPGEFRHISGMWLYRGDSVLVADDVLARATVLDAAGRVGREFALVADGVPIRIVGSLSDGRSIAWSSTGYSATASGATGVVAESVTVIVIDPHGRVERSIGRFVSGYSFVKRDEGQVAVTGVPFATRTSMTVSGGRLILHGIVECRLTAVHPNGTRTEFSTWPCERRRVTQDDRIQALSAVSEGVRFPAALALVSEAAVAGERWQNHPAVARLVAGLDGGVVVQETKTISDSSTRLLRFGPDGRLLARYEIPGHARVLLMDAQYLLIASQNSDGVESLRRVDLPR